MTDELQHHDVDNAGYSQVSGGPGLEVLAWKCPHLTVYSGVHTFLPEAPADVIEQAKTDLLAYYTLTASCGCVPVITPP